MSYKAILPLLIIAMLCLLGLGFSAEDSDADITYTINYKGTGDQLPFTETSTYATSPYNMPITDTIPTRSGYTFMGWATSSSNASNGNVAYTTGDTVQLTNMNNSKNLWAVWVMNLGSVDYTVSFANSPSAGGSVKSGGSAITSLTVPSGTTFWIGVNENQIRFSYNSTLVTATASTSYTFDNWTIGGTVYDGAQRTVTGDMTIQANYTSNLPTYTVSFTTSPYGIASFTSKTVQTGTTWSTSGTTLSFSDGQSVVAPSVTGYSFTKWALLDGTTTSGTINANTTILAYYTANTYTITINAGTGGSVSQQYIYNVPHGTQIYTNNNILTINGTNVTATANTGYSFSSWSNASGTVTGARTITANFTQNNYTVTFAVSPSGSATLSNQSISVPSGTTYWEGTQDGQMRFSYNSTLVTATATTGYHFVSWSSTSGTVNSNITLTATFSSNTYTVSLITSPYGIASFTNVSAQSGTTWSASGTTLSFSDGQSVVAPSVTGYTFSEWSTINGDTSGTITTNVSIIAKYTANTYTVTFDANGGTTPTATKTVTYGQIYGELPTPTYSAHTFNGWFTQQTGGTQVLNTTEVTITADQTLYAQWEAYLPPTTDTFWSNDEYNGTVSVLFHLENGASTEYHIVQDIELYYYDTQSNSFALSDYMLDIDIHNTLGSPFSSIITASLSESGIEIRTMTSDIGKWSNFIVTIDAYNKQITVTKVLNFTSFTQYERKDTSTILDFNDIMQNNQMAVFDIAYSTDGIAPRMQVVDTLVFLNTYGVVMTDPVFDIDQYWVSQTNIRFSIMSFALYGQSITFNGITFPVTNSKVTIPYNNSSNGAVYDPDGTKSRTLTLTNIYLTWQDNHCYLTFNDYNGWTVDLGAYSNRIISMTGLWYFNSGVYESYTESQTYYTKDWWNTEFDFQTFALILLGLLIFAGIIVRLKTRAKVGDLMIIAGAGLIAFILLGGLTI